MDYTPPEIVLFTAGFAHALNGIATGLISPGATLTVALYLYAKEDGEFGVAFAIAAILMILTMVINFSADRIQKYYATHINKNTYFCMLFVNMRI